VVNKNQALARGRILRKYHLSEQSLLSRGMEAEVYALGTEKVLKLYPGTASLEDLVCLQNFYHDLDRAYAPFALPEILSVQGEEGILVTIERRLEGERLSAILPSLETRQMDEMIDRYLVAAQAVAEIPCRAMGPSTAMGPSRAMGPSTAMGPSRAMGRYKLFDPGQISACAAGDWHRFLRRWLDEKMRYIKPYFNGAVTAFASKLERLAEILDQPYAGAYALIHGDFYPGNLMVNPAGQVTALLDFGLFTMWGDPLFDLATAWVFFDMYDALQAGLRQRCLEHFVGKLGEPVRGKLYRYVLIYSILSADLYSPACTDGHSQWCVANLNHAPYWEWIE